MRRANYIIFAVYGAVGTLMTFVFLHTGIETNLRAWLIGIGVTLLMLSLSVISFTAFNEDANMHWFFKILITIGFLGAYFLVSGFFFIRLGPDVIVEEESTKLIIFLVTSLIVSIVVSFFFMYCYLAMRSAKTYLIATILSPIISLAIAAFVIIFYEVIWVRITAAVVGFLTLIAFANALGGDGSSYSSSSDSSDDYETVEKTYVDYNGEERELEDIGGGQYRDDHGEIWNDDGYGRVYKDD